MLGLKGRTTASIYYWQTLKDDRRLWSPSLFQHVNRKRDNNSYFQQKVHDVVGVMEREKAIQNPVYQIEGNFYVNWAINFEFILCYGYKPRRPCLLPENFTTIITTSAKLRKYRWVDALALEAWTYDFDSQAVALCIPLQIFQILSSFSCGGMVTDFFKQSKMPSQSLEATIFDSSQKGADEWGDRRFPWVWQSFIVLQCSASSSLMFTNTSYRLSATFRIKTHQVNPSHVGRLATICQDIHCKGENQLIMYEHAHLI